MNILINIFFGILNRNEGETEFIASFEEGCAELLSEIFEKIMDIEIETDSNEKTDISIFLQKPHINQKILKQVFQEMAVPNRFY